MTTQKLTQFKPTSPGQRFKVRVVKNTLWKGRPEKSLIAKVATGDYRNHSGKITVRHHGGGHKKLLRIIDFKRQKDGVPAKVARIEYDPNRSAFIALLIYIDGEKRYILAPEGLAVGQVVQSGIDIPIAPGNTLPLVSIPEGSQIHCLEMLPGKGAQLVRSAGGFAQLLGKDNQYALVRLRSGEVRKIPVTARATIGSLSNAQHSLEKLGKAGAKRWLGIRPTVRGVAMNPVDHPHGGGEGKTSGGRHPVSPWGKLTKGAKTRRNKRTNHMIVRSRHKSK